MGGDLVEVVGSGRLADDLRAQRIVSERRLTVVVASITSSPSSFEAITEAQFDAGWERPMQEAIDAFARAHDAGRERIVAVVPTIGMSGAVANAAAAATSEALRALVKSAARQWGSDGITVNCVAVAPELFGIGADQVGVVAIAPPAQPAPSAAEVAAALRMLGSEDATAITGATLLVDGGVWMST